MENHPPPAADSSSSSSDSDSSDAAAAPEDSSMVVPSVVVAEPQPPAVVVVNDDEPTKTKEPAAAVVRSKARPMSKRHQNAKKSKAKVTNSAVRRFARRAGVRRMAKCVYAESRAVVVAELYDIVKNAVSFAQHGRRKTVTVGNVLGAAKRRGVTLYGYD